MSYVVAIGGGEIGLGETRPIDEHILDLTGQSKPNILFLPTASEDDRGYSDKFTEYFESLGAIVTVLEVVGGNASSNEIEDKIGSAHAAYGGGGNALTLLDEWEKYGIDTHLVNRSDSDFVFSGQSAGASCWFEHASSSSRRTTEPEDAGLRVITGLGIVRNVLFSPHFLTERTEREPALVGQLTARPDILRGVGVDDGAAYVAQIARGEIAHEYSVAATPDVGVLEFTRIDRGFAVTPFAPANPAATY